MDRPPRPARPAAAGSPAFTLVELLVTMGIIALLVGIVTPAFKSLGAAGRLTAAGNQVVNLMNLARQNSTSKNAMTALLLVTDPASANRHRAFALMELVTPTDGSAPVSSQWRQVGNWTVLAEGTVAEEPNTAMGFDAYPDKRPTPDFPALKYGGVTVRTYDYIVFMPNGVLLQGNTPQLRITEGFYPSASASPVHTHPAAGDGAQPANYYDIFVLNATGRVKVERR